MSRVERWSRIDRVFAQALEIPAGERPAFLDEACAGDAELRSEVERLLAADESGATFLERPADDLPGLPERRPAVEKEGDLLGSYRLVRTIGAGGMGTVYLARREDAHYQRDVALKILRSGLESTQAFHRFLAERQILARLEHPDIARLYDGGSTEDGRPYLVMELVEGLPLDEYCDRHRLSVDQRLELFRRICAAVQYAHRNLLVHRDLKPGNILVTPAGEPKLLDFGIAKRLEPAAGEGADDSRTRTGLRVMTPSHASPEQVLGEAVTTASDVYSLGVLLYELLAGRDPYRAAGRRPHEIERAICEEEPERPSAALFRPGNPTAEELAERRRTRPKALARRLRGDLDNIVLMALRKEPARRYGSADALARDLEKHLRSLPVAARQEGMLYRARKLVRRHRAATAAAAAMALVLLGFVLSLIDQRRQVARERDKARYALAFLVDVFKQADPYQTRQGQLTAREILDQGAARVSRELAGSPDVQAALMAAIGEVDFGLGRFDQAEPLLERALTLREEIYGRDSLEAAGSLELLGRLKAERPGQAEKAAGEQLLRRALALKRSRLGDDSIEVAATLNQLGSLLSETDATPDVEKLHREALAIARKAEGPAGPTVGESLVLLAKLQRDLGDYAASEKLFREGLAVERRALKPDDPRLYRDQAVFGEVLIDLGRFAESEALLRRSLAAQQRILDGEHPDVDATLNNLALAIHRQGRYAEAEVLYRRVLAQMRKHYGPTHTVVGDALGNLAAVLDGQFKPREAIPYLQEVLAIRRRAWGDGHPLVAQALLLLAGAHRNLGEYDQALSLARRSQAILEEAEGADHPHVAYALREIGNIHMARKRYGDAEPYMRRAYEIRRKELPRDSPDLARAKLSLARCLVAAGHLDEAEALVRDAEKAVAPEFKANADFMGMIRSLDEKVAAARHAKR